MKNPIYFLMLLSSIASAAIITVDNKHPYVGDYQTLQAAYSAASSGDSILVSPSQIAYAAITVSKPLTLLGVGFGITAAIGGAHTTSASLSGTMTFDAGSAGSQMEGLDGAIRVLIKNTTNVTIKRNKLSSLDIDNSVACAVTQNEMIVESGIIPLTLSATCSNILINNNVIANLWAVDDPPAIDADGTDLLIINNMIRNEQGATVLTENSQLVNNVIIPNTITGSNNSVRYNIFTANYSTTNGNKANIALNTIFVDYDNENFHLLPGSPAIGAGENGADIGIYGGDAPYVDGGLPGLPSILQLQGDLVVAPGTGLNVQFKAKSNK